MMTEKYTKNFLAKLSSLPEREMRKQFFVRKLSSLEPSEIVELLTSILRVTALGRMATPLESLLAEPEFLKNSLEERRYRLTYEAALKSKLKWISVFFTALPPKKTGPYGYDNAEEAHMEQITLGQRRSMSKGWQKTSLVKLLSDPDPVVITNILNNPKATSTEVIRIASKRPNSAKILNLIALHKRWSRNYNIKKALVMNPYMLPAVSVALLSSMRSTDLQYVTGDEALHPQLKLSARDIIQLRRDFEGSVLS